MILRYNKICVNVADSIGIRGLCFIHIKESKDEILKLVEVIT